MRQFFRRGPLSPFYDNHPNTTPPSMEGSLHLPNEHHRKRRESAFSALEMRCKTKCAEGDKDKACSILKHVEVLEKAFKEGKSDAEAYNQLLLKDMNRRGEDSCGEMLEGVFLHDVVCVALMSEEGSKWLEGVIRGNETAFRHCLNGN